MGEVKINYVEVSAAKVVSHFIKDFSFAGGRQVISSEWFYDPAKGLFLFKLITEEQADQAKAGEQ